MIAITETLAQATTRSQQQVRDKLHGSSPTDCLQEILEGLTDAILILNEVGGLVYTNTAARRICSQFSQDHCNSSLVPPTIWHLCQSLLESQNLFVEQITTLSDELVLDKSTVFRVRIIQLNLDKPSFPRWLVILEDQCDSLKGTAIAEIKKYDLTPREAEIWCLYRCKSSYKDIATELCITINTVKKHMKNIHAKRQIFIETES